MPPAVAILGKIHQPQYRERCLGAEFRRHNLWERWGGRSFIDGRVGNSRKMEVSDRRINKPARLSIGDVVRHGTRSSVPLLDSCRPSSYSESLRPWLPENGIRCRWNKYR